MWNFYPRSPCGERQPAAGILGSNPLISIHALLAESDLIKRSTPSHYPHFYPRSPCGERPRGGGFSLLYPQHFYPRSPCGERPHPVGILVGVVEFLSTLSLRRATLGAWKSHNVCGISIHALLAESDGGVINRNSNFNQFLSTLSLRRATSSKIISSSITAYFYPRSPCGERHVDR